MNPGPMTRRQILTNGAFLLAGGLGGALAPRWLPLSASARPTSAAPAPDPSRVDARPPLALSLRAFQAAARRAVEAGKPLPEELLSLGGINAIRSLSAARDGDVLLFGHHHAGIPAIHVDDFAVAMGHAYETGPSYRGVPGVSIDPDHTASDPWAIQHVRVFGMPPCRMAARMVTVDYHLKQISAGVARATGVSSLYDLRRANAGLCSRDGAGEGEVQVQHRFWFYALYPERPRFEESPGRIMIARPVDVQVLTEREFVNRSGVRTGAAPATTEADQFAHLVTERLLATDVASDYAALRNDFRILEIAKLLRFKDVPADRFSYLLKERQLEPVSIPAYVGGVRREERGQATCDAAVVERRTPQATTVSVKQTVARYHHTSRGGVEARLDVATEEFIPERSGQLGEIEARALAFRPSEEAVVWRIAW